jgi:hypothetical protein
VRRIPAALGALRARLTYANIVATIALFVAVGGGAAYAIDEWTGANIANESLTGADVRGVSNGTTAVNGSLTGADISGQQASAARGAPYVNGSLTTHDIAEETLRGVDVRDNSLKGADIDEPSLGAIGSEDWHDVGTAGEPDFWEVNTEDCGTTQGWENVLGTSVGFYRDRLGRVFLRGGIVDGQTTWGNSGLCSVVFVLPPGYRPSQDENQLALTAEYPAGMFEPAHVSITQHGFVSVERANEDWVTLDGLSFRCGPSGVNGCP